MQDAACAGKQRFRDANEALRIAKLASRRKDTRPNAYKCRYCEGWHIGETMRTRRPEGAHKEK